MKKSIEHDPSTRKSRRRASRSDSRIRQSHRVLRHEVLEARQLLDANSVLDFEQSIQFPLIGVTTAEALEDTAITYDDILTRFEIAATVDSSVPSGMTSENGTFEIVPVPDGEPQLVYTPPADFFGTDEIPLTLLDAAGLSSDVRLTVTVRPVNDEPFDPNTTPDVINALEDGANTIIDLAPLLLNKRVNESGTDETLATAGNIPQTITLSGVQLGAGAPEGASISPLFGGGVRLTLPNDFFTEADLTNSLLPPIPVIYTVNDDGFSYAETSPGVFENQMDTKSLDVTAIVKVFPVNDPPVGRIHRFAGQNPDGTPLILEGTSLTFSVTSGDQSLIPTNALVASLAVGASLPATLDSAGPLEDLGANLTKDSDTETLSQTLTVRSPVSGTTQITTARGGLVDFIDTDGIAGNGVEQIKYTPPLNFASSSDTDLDSFTYLIRDDGISFDLGASGNAIRTSDRLTAIGTVQIEVTPVNDPPQFFVTRNVTVNEDTTAFDPADPGHVTIPGFASAIRPGPSDAVDEQDQNVSFIVTTDNPELFEAIPVDGDPNALQPDIRILPDGTLDFNIPLNQNGVATVTVVAVDDDPDDPQMSTPEQFTITVTPVNDPPEFGYPGTPGAATSITVAEDSGFFIDPDWADPIRPAPASASDEQALQGVVFNVSTDRPDLFSLPPSVTPGGNLRFAPAPDKNGMAVVTIVAVDSGQSSGLNDNSSDPVQLAINITPVNDPPVPGPDQYNGNENTVLQVVAPGLLNGDTDIDGDSLFVSAFGGNVDGVLTGLSTLGATVTLQGDGSFVYDPTMSPALDSLTDNVSITDSFRYRVKDALGVRSLSEGRVSITVSGVNDAPRAINANVRVGRDRETVISAPALAQDPDSQIDPTSAQVVQSPLNGTLVNNGDGTLTYSPRLDFTGTDSFSFTIADQQSNVSLPTLVTVTVVDPPNTEVDVVNTVVNQFVDVNVLQNDLPGGAAINPTSARTFGRPVNGSVENLGNGVIRFTPADNFSGTAQFQYTVDDVEGLVSTPTRVIVSVSGSPGQNAGNNEDVDGSGQTSPIDALLIINHLSRGGANDVDTLVQTGVISAVTGPFMDVDGNGSVFPLDSLRVINRLNAAANGTAGEAPPTAALSLSGVAIGNSQRENSTSPNPNPLVSATNPVIDAAVATLPSSLLHEAIDTIVDDDEDDRLQTEDLDSFWKTFMS